jgi:thiamine biosynthesis protein ThiS
MQILIRVNGEEHRTAVGQTLAGLFAELALDPQRVAVELNREIIRRPLWNAKVLGEGDSLEIVEFVGGGSGLKPTHYL